MSAAHREALWRWLRAPPAPFKIIIFLLAAVAYSTAGFIFFECGERPEIGWFDALWWSVVTMATVGFGDYFPATVAGRLFIGIPTILLGMGMLGYATTQVAVFLIRAETLNRKGLDVHKLSGHILVCNCPSKARLLRLLDELRTDAALVHAPVLLVDQIREELDDDLARREIRFVRGHPARRETLERASVATADRAVVLASDPTQAASDDLTVATCLTLKDLRPDLHVVAECVDPGNRELLERAGCQSIVCVLNLAPGILAQELHNSGVFQVIEELAVWSDDLNNIYLVPIVLPPGPRSFADLARWGLSRRILMLGVKSDGRVLVNPPSERPLAEGDAAIAVADSRPERIDLNG